MCCIVSESLPGSGNYFREAASLGFIVSVRQVVKVRAQGFVCSDLGVCIGAVPTNRCGLPKCCPPMCSYKNSAIKLPSAGHWSRQYTSSWLKPVHCCSGSVPAYGQAPSCRARRSRSYSPGEIPLGARARNPRGGSVLAMRKRSEPAHNRAPSMLMGRAGGATRGRGAPAHNRAPSMPMGRTSESPRLIACALVFERAK